MSSARLLRPLRLCGEWPGGILLFLVAGPALAQPFRDPSLPIEVRAADVVSRLTVAEKISLMSQSQPAIPRLGIAARSVGQEALHGVAYRLATVFPQATGLAHTWDPALIRKVASAIGDEARVYYNRGQIGLQFWSPVVDLARDPRWGRTEEAYGEDPYLSAAIGGAFVRGMQGDDPRYYKTVPTLKHFAANSMEDNRMSASSNVDPRNLREYYLKPFEKITREAGVQSYMVAYNSINFQPCAATNLVRDVARGEWGFHGFVVTDAGDLWGLVYAHQYSSTMAQAAADILKMGMDSITDEQAVASVQAAVNQGLLTETDLDTALRRNFRIRLLLGEFDPPGSVPYDNIPDTALMSDEHKALERQAGRESVVLLKNDGTLPLDASNLKTVAVIGPRANEVERDWYAGLLSYRVTPLDGIRNRLGAGVQVRFEEGTSTIALRARSNERFVTSAGGQYMPLRATSQAAAPGTNETFIAEDFGWGCTTLRSAVSGRYVTLNNGVFGMGSTEAYGWFYSFCFDFVPLAGGYALRYYDGSYVTAAATGNLTATSTLGIAERFDRVVLSDGVAQAAEAARGADAAIVVVGNNTTINGKEDHDRPDIVLPPEQEELIERVYAANPKTVVVLVSSYPFAVNWAAEHVPAMLYSSHGGQELGNSLADVLFGDYNPAGRLTMTWYRSAADLPDIRDFDIRRGRTYWYFQGQPLYPFGYGLSYTGFEYGNLRISPESGGPQDTIRVSFDVRNTGARAGDEVAQLYVHARGSKAQRPLKELKRFERIALEAGETRTVKFDLPLSEAAFWDVRKSRFTVEKGTLDILVGASSADIRLSGSVQVDGEVLAPRQAGEVTRAENYDEYSGILPTRAGDIAETVVGWTEDGDWVGYHEVDFGTGVEEMQARVASLNGTGRIEVHLDGVNGPLAGVCVVPSTGGWYDWSTIRCPDVEASGVHDLYLVFRGPGNGLLNLSWFRFGRAAAGGPAVNEGGAVDAAGFTQPLLRGSWASVFGATLAAAPLVWTAADFQGTAMPLALGGTRVQVNGIDSAVWYVSPTQVNFQVPERVNLGPGVVQVMTAEGASRPVAVTIDDIQPEFYLSGEWAAAQHASDYSLVLPESAARPGETIVLWGSGFGQTWPPITPGQILGAPAPLADAAGLTVTIGGRPATLLYAGMTIAGAYQVNVAVPQLADGDYPVAAKVDGRTTKATALIAVRNAN